ncbi:MAG: 4Fe-4S binding protein [Methanobrevibacter sp.]|jgi:4Fe-4S ferredoxin|nr:4Fe-4S binding protein [Candidatus Methanoflexus mossambicus]
MVTITRDGKDSRQLEYFKNHCIGCGICVKTCPTSSLHLNPVLPIARGIINMDYLNINRETCVLCGLCSFACPFDGFKFTSNEIKNETNKQYNTNYNKNYNKNYNEEYNAEYPQWNKGTKIDEIKCIFCGNCERYCPRTAITVSRHVPERKNFVVGEIKKFTDKCINCKICQEMCPVDAINIKTNKKNKQEKQEKTINIEIDEDKCVYCKICKNVCPTNAIDIICSICMKNEEIPKVNLKGNTIIEHGICVNCSWCQSVCPTNAIKTIKPFEGDINFKENEKHFCKGESCHACKDVCPCGAIIIENNHSKINKEVCILCGTCTNVCPQKIIKLNRTVINLTNITSKSWQKQLNKLLFE